MTVVLYWLSLLFLITRFYIYPRELMGRYVSVIYLYAT
jgi:hypothetical protein